MEIRGILIFMVVLFLTGCRDQRSPFDQLNLPGDCRQVVQVTTKNWDSPTGQVVRFERDEEGRWESVGSSIPVSVGKSGLGWGSGLRKSEDSGPTKKEGDMKAPAGIFTLGTAFGYSESPPDGCQLPYRIATDQDFFVDDVEAPDYNRWVNLEGGVAEANTRWKSFERMRRDDDLYEYGIVVNHNMNPAVPGNGSAIFIHVWQGPGHPTSGCTAMSRENLLILLSWLDSSAAPLFIQAPEGSL